MAVRFPYGFTGALAPTILFMLWPQPLPSRLMMYSWHDFLAILGWSPAGHQTWAAGCRGSKAASGRCPKSFNSKLKFFRCPVRFHNRPHILHTSFKYRPISDRESSGNRPLYVASEEKFLGPDMGRYPADVCLHIGR